MVKIHVGIQVGAQFGRSASGPLSRVVSRSRNRRWDWSSLLMGSEEDREEDAADRIENFDWCSLLFVSLGIRCTDGETKASQLIMGVSVRHRRSMQQDVVTCTRRNRYMMLFVCYNSLLPISMPNPLAQRPKECNLSLVAWKCSVESSAVGLLKRGRYCHADLLDHLERNHGIHFIPVQFGSGSANG